MQRQQPGDANVILYCSSSVIIIGGTNTLTHIRTIDVTNPSREILHSDAYPVANTYAAGVSMGDRSTLVCGGRNGSLTAECHYLDIATFAFRVAPSLPEPVFGHQVDRISLVAQWQI